MKTWITRALSLSQMRTLAWTTTCLFFASCSKNERSNAVIDEGYIVVTGKVGDRYLKACPYSVHSSAKTYGLDVATLPESIVGGIHEIKGQVIQYRGGEILTDVSVDGVSYLSTMEWSKQQNQIHDIDESDPFGFN